MRNATDAVGSSHAGFRTPTVIKVVVGFDGSSGGHDALALGRGLGRMLASELLVVAAYPFREDPRPEDAERFNIPTRAAAEAVLDDARTIVGRAERPTFAAIPGSTPATALHEVAEGEDASVIVVGVSAEAGTRIQPASTTWVVLHHSPCAVAVAPRGWQEVDRPLARIGIAHDGKPEARAALDAAAALLDQAQAPIDRIEIVHVAATLRSEPLPLDRTAGRLTVLGPVRGVELHGDAAAELVEYADHVDLLVLGAHDRGPLGRLLLGSVSREVVEHVRTPVLVRPWRRSYAAALGRAAAFL